MIELFEQNIRTNDRQSSKGNLLMTSRFVSDLLLCPVRDLLKSLSLTLIVSGMAVATPLTFILI